MSELTSILRALTELHERLLGIAKEKQEILVKGEIHALLSVLSEEAKLIKKIKEQDEARAALLGENTSLSYVIKQHPHEEEKQEWMMLHERLSGLLEEIGRVNQVNQQLLQQSLSFTQYMIEQMVPKESSGLYHPSDVTKEAGDSIRFFDAKA
jgi:flagellar biosynthesis/type III secretory pathway chaperone